MEVGGAHVHPLLVFMAMYMHAIALALSYVSRPRKYEGFFRGLGTRLASAPCGGRRDYVRVCTGRVFSMVYTWYRIVYGKKPEQYFEDSKIW